MVPIEAVEQIKRFEEFIQLNAYPLLLKNVSAGLQSIIIDGGELAKFDPELVDNLLDDPEEVIKAAEMAVLELDLPSKPKDFKVRFKNLPSTQKTLVRDIRSKHVGGFLSVEGIVRQKSDVRPQVTSARFECPSCGNIISVLQLDTKFKDPSRCGCGRKGKFHLVSKEMVDAQRIVLEESPDMLDSGDQPKRMDIFLKHDLVSPLTDRRTNPGTKILVNGIVKEVPITLKEGGQSIRFDLLIEANYVNPIDEDVLEIGITPEEEAKIKELGADPNVYEKLSFSLAPSIYGHDRTKEAIIAQLVGGCQKKRTDGTKTRGDLHILLIGDPGAGKSMLLKRSQVVAPKSRYVTGKGATGAGLTAAVVRDEFLKGWALEAGALVLANNGFVMIDELDKMSKEDRSAMHEALEQQSVSISKANIQATLRCETTVLAAANPKFGRFDPYELIAKQIDLPPTLINRFDLIFPIKDLPDQKNDAKMASFILTLHKEGVRQDVEIGTDLLRKFIAYTRRNIHPQLTDEAIEEIKEYYVNMRNSGQDEGGIRSIPITARQLEALVRLAEASAKVRLSQTVSREDAKRSISLVDYCLRQVGLDKETGKIDIDRISSGITASQRNRIVMIKEIIGELEKTKGSKTIGVEDILHEAEGRGIPREQVDDVIEKLKRAGDIFEPKKGFVTRI